LILLARLERLELPTRGLEVRCSIHLSYRRTCFLIMDNILEWLAISPY
jgi:hypothetical protein